MRKIIIKTKKMIKNEELFGADNLVYMVKYEIENFFEKGQASYIGWENVTKAKTRSKLGQ